MSKVARKASVAQEENRNLDGTVIASIPKELLIRAESTSTTDASAIIQSL